LNILVIDNFPIFRKGIVSVLEDNFLDYNILEASNLSEASTIIKKYQPHIIFMDINTNSNEDYNFIENIRLYNQETKIMAMGSFIKKEDINKCFNMGIHGIILKNALIEDFVYATKIINRGKNYTDPELTSHIDFNNSESLTKRELDVLMEISKGKTNNEIAKDLFISEHTVKKHIGNIFSKLNLTNRTEAALYAGSVAI
jgi:two-component system nitrate/nitrite response regulator NarL